MELSVAYVFLMEPKIGNNKGKGRQIEANICVMFKERRSLAKRKYHRLNQFKTVEKFRVKLLERENRMHSNIFQMSSKDFLNVESSFQN